jgi:hypothetical protein
MLSVDGTDCPFEATGSRWISHKFKKAGVRYEVAVGIKTGDVCWINGPFPAGQYPDINIFRMGLKHYLDEHERVEADKGYRGDASIKTYGPLYTDVNYVAMKADVAARHETVNKRLKQYGCLTTRFRHDVAKHAACFRAVAVLTQLAIEYGEPLYQVAYSDNY